MSAVELARAAVEDLGRLIAALTLPADTRERVRASLTPLIDFPRLGTQLPSRWAGTRFILGPWRWMLVVYEYREDEDRVVVLTLQDASSSTAATSS